MIGAGPAGLTAVKCLREAGLEVVAFEKYNDIGGLWHYDENAPSGGGIAYCSLKTNTSKQITAFSDFPFPDDVPDFPSRAQVLDYLNNCADHFSLRPFIRLNTAVKQITLQNNHQWLVVYRPESGTAESELFDAVVVANGFYQKPLDNHNTHFSSFLPASLRTASFENLVLNTYRKMGHTGETMTANLALPPYNPADTKITPGTRLLEEALHGRVRVKGDIQQIEADGVRYVDGSKTKADTLIDRPETIEETAEMVAALGGVGLWARVDHREPEQVKALFERVNEEQGRLDILVNNLSGDQFFNPGVLSGREPVPFWQYPIEKGIAAQQNGVHTHLITSYYAAPLMVARQQGLIIEINDGNCLDYNGVGVYYSLSKTALVLLAYLMSEELKEHNIPVVSLTPGWLRSESMLDGFGVAEENWRDAVADWPGFEKSETTSYIGRAVVALATDPNIMDKTGHALSAGYLAREYGFTDIDGRQPPGYCEEGMFKDGFFVPAK